MFILTSFISSTVSYSVIVLSSVLLGALLRMFILTSFVSSTVPYSVIVLSSVWLGALLRLFILTSFVLSAVSYSVIVFCLVRGFVRAVHLSFVSSTGSYWYLVIVWSVSVRGFVKVVHHLVSSAGSYSVIVLQVFCLDKGSVGAVLPSFSCFSSRLLFTYCLVFCLVRGFVKDVHSLVSSAGSYSVIVLSSVWWGALLRMFILLFHQQALIQLLSCLLFGEVLC